MAFPFFRRRAARPAPAVQPPEAETRGAVPRIGELATQSDPNALRILGLDLGDSAGEPVTIERALGVPAIGCAVGFLSRTLASIPVHVFDKGEAGRARREGDPVAALLNEAPNDEQSAYDFRRESWQEVFTAGRSVSFIERNGGGEVINLWPLEIDRVQVERRDGRTLYHYRDAGRRLSYAAREVLDLKFMPGANRLAARSPVHMNAGTIGLALAVTKYGRTFFARGGVPPFTISGPIRTAGGTERASADLSAAVKAAADAGSLAVGVPEGHTVAPLGFNPEDMQMEKTQRFLIEEFARIWGLPPVFLHDLSHGTFANTEQQDLSFIKHALVHWISLYEGEINLKLFGRGPRESYAEKAVAGIARGDLKSRAEAIARQITTGQLTPNEARRLDNRPDLAGGDVLFMQGAMAPVERLARGEGSGISAGTAGDGTTTKGKNDG